MNKPPDIARNKAPLPTAIRPAAEYMRMSTDHQRYSTENQAGVIRKYAEARGFAIVRTYCDMGKSGLQLTNRDGLKELINDVQGGKAAYQAILVYDVSRWGRFQDADESAYYEYICRRAGISIHYCAEQFENDGSPLSTIVKGIKRVMAAEYSRELSAKVFVGQCHIAQLGFRVGGSCGYGLRRQLIDEQGKPKGELTPGQRKNLQTDRVVLIPGPRREIKIVRWIFRRYVEDGRSILRIAQELNKRGIAGEDGRPWQWSTVRQVLFNEKYVGNAVWNKTSTKLRGTRIRNAPDMWIRNDSAYSPIVDRTLFDAARVVARQWRGGWSEEALLHWLRRVWDKHGTLSARLINSIDKTPSVSTFIRRFGSLYRAYEHVGYVPHRDYRFVGINREVKANRPAIIEDIVAGVKKVGGTVERSFNTHRLLINGEFTVSVIPVRYRESATGPFWRFRLNIENPPDITIATRLDSSNHQILDYFVLPTRESPTVHVIFREKNHPVLGAYRSPTLDPLFEKAARSGLSPDTSRVRPEG